MTELLSFFPFVAAIVGLAVASVWFDTADPTSVAAGRDFSKVGDEEGLLNLSSNDATCTFLTSFSAGGITSLTLSFLTAFELFPLNASSNDD